MPVIYQKPFTQESFREDFIVRGGEWHVEDGWLTGKNPGNFPGMVTMKKPFPGNIMLDFKARTVPPCTHDINVMWNGSWDETNNLRSVAYVAGVQGWWDGKVGFEKSPSFELNAGTKLFSYSPGQIVHGQFGSIDGHIFIIVDGRLVLEVTDPDPIDSNTHTMVGLEAYCSHIQFRDFSIRRAVFEPFITDYNPEFQTVWIRDGNCTMII